MKNYIQPGNTLTLTAPANVTGGQIVTVGNIVGVAAGDAASGADFDLVTVGVFDLPKVGAQAITVGATVYVDDDGLVTTTATDNVKLGVAVTAAANPSPSVNVRLSGAF